jgi:hypothetical protein
MKIETIKSDDISPIHQLRNHWREDNAPQHLRVDLPLISLPGRTATVRAYLRGLRAAEMAAWEQTGGDYLLPRYAAYA